MIFKKYEFTDSQWATIRPTLYSEDEEGNETLIPSINAIVEIGHICKAWSEGEEPECTDLSPMYSVDMLLNEEEELLQHWDLEVKNFVQICPIEMLNKLPHPLGIEETAVPAE